jgi:hypothetical protein
VGTTFPSSGKTRDVPQEKTVFDTDALMQRTIQQYPILGKYQGQLAATYTPNTGMPNLETWPPGETGTGPPGRYRPTALPPDKYGAEIYDTNVDPMMLMGDYTTHALRFIDPNVKNAYAVFQQMWMANPASQGKMQEDYQWARKNEGEDRPFGQWLEMSGMPGYFRGYLFQQAPRWWQKRYYTPQMIDLFNNVDAYLKGKGGVGG